MSEKQKLYDLQKCKILEQYKTEMRTIQDSNLPESEMSTALGDLDVRFIAQLTMLVSCQFAFLVSSGMLADYHEFVSELQLEHLGVG